MYRYIGQAPGKDTWSRYPYATGRRILFPKSPTEVALAGGSIIDWVVMPDTDYTIREIQRTVDGTPRAYYAWQYTGVARLAADMRFKFQVE